MPLTLAIVDDSSKIRRTLRTFFQSNTDWKICGEAENGQSAVELVQRLRPDVVVLDFSMPVMNGLEAARNIAAISPKTGIVLFTAHTSRQLLAAAEDVGIRAVVQKDGSGSLQLLLKALADITGSARAA